MIKRLGVLGGMGPAASAEFMARLVAKTPAKKDQDHIPTILWSDPRIPDRSISLLNGDDLPLPYLLEGIHGLKSANCSCVVIPCNTAHFWFDELSKHIKIIHIVDSVADALISANVENTTIGVMGTQATIELKLYQNHLNTLGWNCITPSTEEMNSLVQPAIDLIKANDMINSHYMLMQVIDSLISRGANAVILGCTEIPLAIQQEYHLDIPLINSIDSLVNLAINWYTH